MGLYNKPLKIYQASSKALAEIESYEDSMGTKPPTVGKRRHPWNQMKIGECFIETFDNNTEKKLNACANFQKSFSKKTFIVIKHEDYKIFEVARIA